SVEWQRARGLGVSITLAEVQRVAKEHHNLSSRILENPTVEQLKNELAAGRPVIVPASGRTLGNPYFTPPGPIYHMLVLIGYDETSFITNDPGTKRGAAYRYRPTVLMKSIHDFVPGDIGLGPKRVMVLD
ncbi:MAG: C39 family peptidase, partial [Patescibacteria group bacterium]